MSRLIPQHHSPKKNNDLKYSKFALYTRATLLKICIHYKTPSIFYVLFLKKPFSFRILHIDIHLFSATRNPQMSVPTLPSPMSDGIPDFGTIVETVTAVRSKVSPQGEL